MEQSAEEALETLKLHGATVLPGPKVLQQAAHGKVFSGKKVDGGLWKVTKIDDDTFVAE